MNRLVSSVLCALVAGLSCGTAPAVARHPNILVLFQRFDSTTLMMRFDAPAEYVQWMNEVVACSGIDPDDHWDTYWIVPRRFLKVDTTEMGLIVNTWAEHVGQSHAIIFGVGFEMDAPVVRHEFLHHLLQVAHDPIAHDSTYFNGKCRGLVH